jgi:transposase
MTLEQIQQLQIENAQLREQLAARDALIAQLVERIQLLEAQKAQDSHNSSKPPSSDGYKRSPKQCSLRKKSGKAPGAQPGHKAAKLEMSQTPAQVVAHFPMSCQSCQQPFSDLVTATPEYEPRQEFELPLPVKLVVTEHRAYRRACSHCKQLTTAPFPPHLVQTTQYGNGFRAWLVYLSQQQLLPYHRIVELVAHLTGQTVSPGTIVNAVVQTSQELGGVEERTKLALQQAKVVGSDETGVRIAGRRGDEEHWDIAQVCGRKCPRRLGQLPTVRGVSARFMQRSPPARTDFRTSTVETSVGG